MPLKAPVVVSEKTLSPLMDGEAILSKVQMAPVHLKEAAAAAVVVGQWMMLVRATTTSTATRTLMEVAVLEVLLYVIDLWVCQDG